MKVIDRTKAVTQHVLDISFKKLLIVKKIKKKTPKKNKKKCFSLCLLRHGVVRVCVSFCV